MDEDGRLRALQAVLRVAARHPNLLDEEAFDDLAAAFAPLLAGGRLNLMVPDGPMALRVFALSRGTETNMALGQRVEGREPNWSLLFEQRRPVVCDDMRLGDDVERATAGPTLSYVALPCRVSGPRPRAMRDPGDAGRDRQRTAAVLVVSFVGAGEAGKAPIEALQELADTVGPALERSAYLAREHRLAMILETSGDAMLAWDRQGRITDANSAAAVLTGRPRPDLIGTPIAELLDPLPGAAGGAGASTEGTRHSLLARTPAGLRRLTVAATVTAVERDALVAAHVLLRNLSQVVRAEREAAARLARIHELEEQHRTLLDNAPLIIFRLDPGTLNLAYLNLHAERLLGVPTAEALATPGFLRAAHADREGVAAFDAAVARAAEGARSLPYEARLSHRAEGATITVRGSVYPLLAEGGHVAAIEGVLADVSAEHAARTRLVQADRLSTLGTLAAGVAHEINNPAAFILLGLDLLDRSLSGRGVTLDAGAAASAHETLRELRESIRRIVDIARDLRLFASAPGAGGGRRTVVDVNRTVESALSLTRGQLLERAQIDHHLEDVPPVLMDDGRLGQVVVNLLVNAAQAIPRARAGDNLVRVSTRSDGHTVEIEVLDTGTGIPEEVLPRIWQPFFTTKSPEVGTGLGLSISREIVEQAGGTIRVESPVAPTSGGARFVISLPAAGQGDDMLAPASSPPASAPPAGRVLVVDDEPALGRALAEELGRRHEVVVARSAEAALAELRRRAFDVILCDLRMPGMSGEALYARVLSQDPEQAEGFVFMTGVGFGADIEHFLSASGRPVLEKPFAASKALECIARVMKRRALLLKAAVLGGLTLIPWLAGCGPPPPPAPLDTGLLRSGVAHPMSASGFGVFSTLLARDGQSARLTRLSLRGFEYAFDFDQRDLSGRTWRAECALEWEIHPREQRTKGHDGGDLTNLRCAATVGDTGGSASLEVRADGLDASAPKPWTGRLRGMFSPAAPTGAEVAARTIELAVRGDGTLFTAAGDKGTVALIQVLPEPGAWVAPGAVDDATTPGIFFMAAALVFARTALPPRPPPEYLDQRP